jgi:hypothetical protein
MRLSLSTMTCERMVIISYRYVGKCLPGNYTCKNRAKRKKMVDG